MSSISFEEKRSFPRFPIKIPLVCLDENSNKDLEAAEVFDISAQGIGIITNEELSLGVRLNITLKMPDNGEQVSRKGKVIWIRKIQPVKYRTGVKLEEPKIKPIPLVLRIINFQRKY
ncbi:MAG: PilZ domain-containing protein [Candidatus Omnitrophota bacterium]